MDAVVRGPVLFLLPLSFTRSEAAAKSQPVTSPCDWYYFVSYAALPFIPTPIPTAAWRKLFPFALLFLKREPRFDSRWLRVALLSSLNRVFQHFESIEYRFLDFEICSSRYCIGELHVTSHKHVLPILSTIILSLLIPTKLFHNLQ